MSALRDNSTAVASKQTAGLNRARTGKSGTSKADQAEQRLVTYVGKHPGITTKLAAWRLAGLPVDSFGNPADPALAAQIADYEFLKKRASDAAAMPPNPDDKETVRQTKLQRMNTRPLVYGPAQDNPYTESGGHGLYLNDGTRKPPKSQSIPSADGKFSAIESTKPMARVDADESSRSEAVASPVPVVAAHADASDSADSKQSASNHIDAIAAMLKD